MNKPPEEEIWPNAREIRKRPWRHTIFTESGGIRIEVDEDHGEKEYSDENIKTKYIRTHRTHCPECWEKYEASVYLSTEIGGHTAFHCRADDDWDDRFPREG